MSLLLLSDKRLVGDNECDLIIVTLPLLHCLSELSWSRSRDSPWTTSFFLTYIKCYLFSMLHSYFNVAQLCENVQPSPRGKPQACWARNEESCREWKAQDRWITWRVCKTYYYTIQSREAMSSRLILSLLAYLTLKKKWDRQKTLFLFMLYSGK